MLDTVIRSKLDSKLMPAYIVTGDDLYLRAEVQRYFENLVEPSVADFNLVYFGGDVNVSQIINALMHEPVMSEKRVVIVKDFSVKLSDEENSSLKSVLSGADTGNILVLFVNPTQDKVLNSISAGLFERIDCNHPDERFASEAIEIWCKEKDVTISNKAVVKLVKYTARDLQKICNELVKLFAYCDNNTICDEDVDNIVHKDVDYMVYELSNTLADRQSIQAKTVLDRLLETTQPLYLLKVITTQYRRMLHCLLNKGQNDVGAYLGIKDFAVKRTLSVASKYTQAKLKKIVDRLTDLENDFKSGKMSESVALNIAFFNALSVC